VKANAKQIIEGKAAPKVPKKQGDTIATKGTKAKIAPAGMAMYQGSAIQGLRSGQTKEISLTTALFFYSCNIPTRNANAAVFRWRWCRHIKMAPASYAPPNSAAIDGELLERLYNVVQFGCSTECRTSHILVGHFVQIE
jgi:hypothetical protein